MADQKTIEQAARAFSEAARIPYEQVLTTMLQAEDLYQLTIVLDESVQCCLLFKYPDLGVC
jgi:hypothetical protein